MSDRYLKILPFIALSKENGVTLTILRVFTILCDMADEDGYLVDPESYLSEIGLSIRKAKVVGILNSLKRLGWIDLVETITNHNIWKIMLEPHQSANVKKFIVTDGSIEVTIKSVGKNDWWKQLNEDQSTTINKVDWVT